MSELIRTNPLATLADAHSETTGPRIAYVLSTYPALTERFYHLEIEGLRQQGIQVDVYSLVRRPAPGTERWEIDRSARFEADIVRQFGQVVSQAIRNLPELIAIWGQTIRLSGLTLRDRLLATGSIVKALSLLSVAQSREIRVIHGAWCTWPAYVAWVISRLEPSIQFTLACNAYDYDARMPTTALIAEDASLIFTHADARRQEVETEWPRPSRPVVTVYRGSRLPDEPARATRSGILCVGAIVRYKGFEVLLDSLAALREMSKPVKLTIIGGAPAGFQDYQQELLDRTSELGLADLVEWCGPRPHHEVMQAMSQAEAFVLASLWCDILPNVIKEALASRTPVITSDTFAIEELIQDKITGLLVPKGDAQALAEAIAWTLDNPERAGALATNGYNLVRANFDLVQTSKKRADYFRHLLNS